MTDFEYDVFCEFLNIFDEARDVISKQDLSDRTIKYLIDIVDKDIEIASKKYATYKKALDDVCYELAYREYNNDSSGVQIEYHAQIYRKKYLGELENGK